MAERGETPVFDVVESERETVAVERSIHVGKRRS
jgi:hypothetical protein